MSTISLFDFLEVKPRSDNLISIEIRHELGSEAASAEEDIPVDERNLVFQAFDRVRKLLIQENRIPSAAEFGVDVLLEKRIPSSAGLGGASSDAAAAIVAANQIWNAELSEFEMREIAATIGSDVPFFLGGGQAVCRGRGELIEPFDVPISLCLVVAKPTAGLSTAEVYQNCAVPAEPQSSQSLIAGLTTGNAQAVAAGMHNRLEEFAEPMTTAIAEMREQFSQLGCLGHQMSGSGSSYFGVFQNFADARRAANVLRSRQPALRVHCCRTLSPTMINDMTTNSDRPCNPQDGHEG